MSVLFPIVYMLGGLLVGRYLPSIRGVLSRLLTKVFIPYVIVYNILTYQDGTAMIAIFSIVFCSLLFAIRYWVSRDNLDSLIFSYLNIGWLGLPLAIAIFGDAASRIIISAYIGSSVFGNIASVAAMQKKSSWNAMVSKTLLSPPVLALAAGLALKVLPVDFSKLSELQFAYDLSKNLMSIVGMCILGIWLYSSRITVASIQASVPMALMRLIFGSIIVLFAVWGGGVLGVDVVTNNIPVLFILPLLPPAANIVVLETYYRGTGHSASMIASGTLVSLALLSLYASALLIFM